MHVNQLVLVLSAIMMTNCIAVKKNRQAPLPPLEDKGQVDHQQPTSIESKSNMQKKDDLSGNLSAYINIRKIRFASKNELSSCGLDACVLLVVDDQKFSSDISTIDHINEMSKLYQQVNKLIELVDEENGTTYSGLVTGVGVDQTSPAWTAQFKQLKQADLNQNHKFNIKYTSEPGLNESNLILPDQANVEF